jgi:type IV pilus assembly protein PilW
MRPVAPRRTSSGLSLVELLVAMTLCSLLMLGLVHITSAAGSSAHAQDDHARLQDQVRHTHSLLSSAIGEAGFIPEPWNAGMALAGIDVRTDDNVSAGNDRLVLRTWSDRNCFENLNPLTRADGRPAFHLRESSFDLTTAGQLARDCRYGPDEDNLTVQIRRQGLVPGVESFQLLFGEDTDRDGNVDRWLRAGNWNSPEGIRGVRVGVLLVGERAVGPAESGRYRVLDRVETTPADGKLRQQLEFAVAIRGGQ